MEEKKILADFLSKYRNLSFSKITCESHVSRKKTRPLTVDDIVLVRIKRITFEDEAPRKEAIENVLSTLRLQGVNFLYIIRGCKDHVEFYYGVVKNTIIDSANIPLKDKFQDITESILKRSIEGNFRGSDTQIIDDEQTSLILNELNSKKCISCIEGVPGINKDEAVDFQGVDRLVDTMLGDEFLFVVT